MASIFCPQCSQRQPATHLYCMRCGEPLPTQLLGEGPAKRARFFAGIKVGEADPEDAYLRVSCYVRDQVIASPEGTVVLPGHHVRFSVWVASEARCVLSLPAGEAADLADFIAHELTLAGRTDHAIGSGAS